MGTFKFDEIAFNSTEKKKPVDEDKYTYLGLEHLDSDSIYVTRYGADVAPKGDKLIMYHSHLPVKGTGTAVAAKSLTISCL